ncbi:hypothetical protein JZ751_006383 [Albula glossodonta]|uniref:Uncharacterized protein n=1 Tax=Albula glossodonta TaxID=121402 RepID=A0A8T2NB36_9TELE|nr:hypothetical protein JZ751_006383 [Albula glossodonta]
MACCILFSRVGGSSIGLSSSYWWSASEVVAPSPSTVTVMCGAGEGAPRRVALPLKEEEPVSVARGTWASLLRYKGKNSGLLCLRVSAQLSISPGDRPATIALSSITVYHLYDIARQNEGTPRPFG